MDTYVEGYMSSSWSEYERILRYMIYQYITIREYTRKQIGYLKTLILQHVSSFSFRKYNLVYSLLGHASMKVQYTYWIDLTS